MIRQLEIRCYVQKKTKKWQKKDRKQQWLLPLSAGHKYSYFLLTLVIINVSLEAGLFCIRISIGAFSTNVSVWLSDNMLISINTVTLHRVQLVPVSVTILGLLLLLLLQM